MNTRLGKSFGLAFVVAVGILAVMFALGTFNAQKAGAVAQTVGTVATDPSPASPGGAIELRVTITNDATAIDSFARIKVKLASFGLPASIDVEDVYIDAEGNADGNDGNPDGVTVSGDTITLRLNRTDTGANILADGTATVIFWIEAGITAPTTAGSYRIEVDGNEAPEAEAVDISATLTVDPKSGGSGTAITVTGKAFADGTGSLYSSAVTSLGTDEEIGGGDDVMAVGRTKLTNIDIDDGSFSVEVAAKDLKSGERGYSQLEVMDADGATDATATFQLTGTTTISPESVDKGKLITIKLSDWIQKFPDAVKIGGVGVDMTNKDGVSDPAPAVPDPDEDGVITFYVKVGGDVDLGTKTLVLFKENKRLDSTSVEITSLGLSVSPSTAVAGQEVTVEGTGFSTTDDNQLATLTVGGTDQAELSNRNDVDDYDVLSNGRIVITFDVPDGVTHGSKTIRVTDDDDRVGEVALMVREPTITLNPITSRRATTVSVSGTGFPANKNITANFGTETGIATGRTDNTGNFSASFVVPSDATIGGEVEVTASFGDDYSAEATHTVPDKEITVTPEIARSGDTVVIVGTGFPRYADVQVKIGDGVFRATNTRTDGIGDFTVSVIVPGIDSGTHVLQVDAGGSIATWVMTVPDVAVVLTRPSGDVFADLTEAGNLTVVWYFDNDTKDWSFYDPRPEVAAAVDLTKVTSGDNVWIQVVANQMFQGEMLTAGWNLVTLN